ncbi:hypothetical protein [Pendulispora albinea]|uniref:Uncharacterized protein n=1 Tax=Pendulispora albinea TaxID=2741071 RepID=A0ABZ2LND5_9BACT
MDQQCLNWSDKPDNSANAMRVRAAYPGRLYASVHVRITKVDGTAVSFEVPVPHSFPQELTCTWGDASYMVLGPPSSFPEDATTLPQEGVKGELLVSKELLKKVKWPSLNAGTSSEEERTLDSNYQFKWPDACPLLLPSKPIEFFPTHIIVKGYAVVDNAILKNNGEFEIDVLDPSFADRNQNISTNGIKYIILHLTQKSFHEMNLPF